MEVKASALARKNSPLTTTKGYSVNAIDHFIDLSWLCWGERGKQVPLVEKRRLVKDVRM